jgi:hypothetical protein
MDDDNLEQFYPHKKGDIVIILNYQDKEINEWRVIKYLIGGYELKNVFSSEIVKAETKNVDFAVPNLKKIFGHENHDVVVSYVSNPEYDRYIYCRDCKKELKTKYKKLPRPNEIYFNKG